MVDFTHFKYISHISIKIDRATFCTEWKSALFELHSFEIRSNAIQTIDNEISRIQLGAFYSVKPLLIKQITHIINESAMILPLSSTSVSSTSVCCPLGQGHVKHFHVVPATSTKLRLTNIFLKYNV